MAMIGFDPNRARYGVVFFNDRRVLVLIDEWQSEVPTPKLADDAEAVVADCVAQGWVQPGWRVVYRDTEGKWAEIRVRDNKFAGFAPILASVADMFEAVAHVSETRRP